MGEALLASLADAAGGTVGVRSSYTAKGWHAQISKLTSSDRGYLAAEKAGLSVTARTLRGWLAEETEPNAENRRKIAEAYGIMRGRWPEEVERRQITIRGAVKIGNDRRDRGTNGTSGLVIDGSAGNWGELQRMWEEGDVAAQDFADQFVEDVLEADLGESSEPWEFPGTSYTVEW